MPPQWVTTGPTLMEKVERTSTEMVRPQQQGVGLSLRNSYAMDMNRSKRNCYACGEFGHLAKHCRNWGTEMNRRIEIDQDNNNLNGNRGLVSPN